MLAREYLRENADTYRTALENRGASVDLDRFLELDAERRRAITHVEQLKAQRNAASPAIATPLPSASAATAATAEATAGAHATGAPSAAKPPPAKAAPRTPAASKPASKPPAPSCSPPYTIDSNGIRRPKPECL